MKFSDLRNSRKWEFAKTNDFRLIWCEVCSFDIFNFLFLFFYKYAVFKITLILQIFLPL